MRIIVADHHEQVLLALTTMLEQKSGVDLVGVAVNAQDLLRLATDEAAEVVVVDRNLPGSSVTNLVADLHLLEKKPFIIVMGSEPDHSRMALSAGADAFVSKGDSPEWLLQYLDTYTNRSRV